MDSARWNNNVRRVNIVAKETNGRIPILMWAIGIIVSINMAISGWTVSQLSELSKTVYKLQGQIDSETARSIKHDTRNE
jgi:hypothetical protein